MFIHDGVQTCEDGISEVLLFVDSTSVQFTHKCVNRTALKLLKGASNRAGLAVSSCLQSVIGWT